MSTPPWAPTHFTDSWAWLYEPPKRLHIYCGDYRVAPTLRPDEIMTFNGYPVDDSEIQRLPNGDQRVYLPYMGEGYSALEVWKVQSE